MKNYCLLPKKNTWLSILVFRAASGFSSTCVTEAGERVVQIIIAYAANLPLKDDSIDVIVSAVGFQNMQDSKKVFKEVRSVSKKLIALCIFFEDGDPNLAHVSDRGLHVSKEFVRGLEEAGWNSRVENSVRARAEPTPQSGILGIRPDMLPITSTTIEFTTVIAK